MNKPTLGGGVRPPDADLSSQEVGAIVFEAFNIKFTQRQLDEFIEMNKNKMPMYAAGRIGFEIETGFPGRRINFSSDYVACISVQANKTGPVRSLAEEYKRIFDLFDPTYFNIFYGLNTDKNFEQATQDAYSRNDLTAQEEVKRQGPGTVKVTLTDHTKRKQIAIMQGKLLQYAPEDAVEINCDPVAYVINLIDQFIETQAAIDNAIASGQPMIAHAKHISLIDEMEKDSDSDHFKGNQ